MSKFLITQDIISKVKRFNLMGRKIEFKIKPIPSDANPVKWVRDSISEIIQYGTQDLQPGDKVGFTFCSENFKNRGPGWASLRDVSTVKIEDIWNVISGIFQSNSSALNTDNFCLGITSVRLPTGRGNERRIKYNNFTEECSKRNGIISIQNKDNLCLPRAIVVGISLARKDVEYKKIRRDIGKIQTKRALELLEKSEVIISPSGAGIPELKLFQNYLKNFKIRIYKYGGRGREIIYEGVTREEMVGKINLLHHDGHFNVITSLTAAFACVYYCEECHIPYNTKNKHRCAATCPCCQQPQPCEQTGNITCEDCERKFRGPRCFENHKKIGSLGSGTVCEHIKLCKDCLKTIKHDRNHICGEIYCKICRSHVSSDHMCYMQPDTGKPKTEDVLFVFFDLETQQKTTAIKTLKIHEPNLCVVQNRCDKCIDEINLYFCQKCGFRQQIFKTIDEFMEYLFDIRKKFKSVICLAHFGQAFDIQFILKYVLEKTDIKPELIMRGTKILLMEFQNVKFLDSYNYLPMKLSKLPQAFDLPPTLKKGYFPHLFNTEDNENYSGPLPDVNYYDPDSMMPDDRIKFLEWYENHKQNNFDMERDIRDYCISDVNILTQACIKFRNLLMREGNVCPFMEACTIASCCNKVFRRNFLKPKTIGIIPKGGYRWTENQSKIAIQWIIYEENQRGINIRHAAKQKEAIVAGVKVDGYCSDTKQIFNFLGCWWHGCRVCFEQERDKPLQHNSNETLNSRYKTTVATTDRLRRMGLEVIEMWECTFQSLLRANKELKLSLDKHPLLSYLPLDPRDSFYGGRTGNTRKYYKINAGEQIKYIDVCSLYPWVSKYCKFPIGHPEIYVGEECRNLNFNEIDGLIKCKIIPPQNLYHAVLPTKMNDKLTFVLCRTCGLENNQIEECVHSEEERAITGTWVVDEVRKAIEKGYQILETYEVWKYEIEKYDAEKKVGGLFSEMMNKFIKLKQQASGWSQSCVTQTDKEHYIETFFNQEGVRLEFKEIIENAGLRSVAKLMLNSFWGKMGQRENQPKTSVMKQPAELFEMLSNPSVLVHHILPINEETIVVNWEHREEAYDILSTVNVCIAAYTTCQARLRLYSFLEKLGSRVIYFDTDSIIYISKEGEYEPATGDCIGDMTDELKNYGQNSYITEFVSGGPKNYAFKVYSTKDLETHVVCKVKGISLNYNAAKLVNFESIKEMILNENSEPIYILSNNIRRTDDHDVITKEERKMYKPNFTKRKFLEDFDSVPFGFKRSRPS